MLRWLWLLSLLPGLTAQAQELTLRTVQQSGSLVKYDPDGAPTRPGLCLEILRAVERVDPGLHFSGLEQQAPLKRVERLLDDGQLDAFFCLLKSPERERQWRYAPVPLYTIRHVVVQRADDAHHYDTLAELAAASQRKPVLVMRGTALSRRLVAADVAWAAGLAEAPGRFLDYVRYSFMGDAEKAKRELGFEARYASRDALNSYLRYRYPPRARRAGAPAEASA